MKTSPLLGRRGLGQRENQVQGQERHFPAAPPCLMIWNPLGTRKRSSASSWSFTCVWLWGIFQGHLSVTPISRQGSGVALEGLSFSYWYLGSPLRPPLCLSFPGVIGGGDLPALMGYATSFLYLLPFSRRLAAGLALARALLPVSSFPPSLGEVTCVPASSHCWASHPRPCPTVLSVGELCA